MPGHPLIPITEHDHLVHELRSLLSSCQELTARHQTLLAPYRDPDGYVFEDQADDYDKVRIKTAVEASDHLDTVIDRLTTLVGPTAPRAFALTFAGRERHDGEAPTTFVVNATSLNDAALVLAGLPSWHEWYQSTGVDIVYLPEQSHPGLPTRGHFADLRSEQRTAASPPDTTLPSAARFAAPVTAMPPAPTPASSAARTPH
ncbi:hypothetical protein [Streptomyces sp. NPDC048106]|uniref:hypothetical protein n=1 Tax=Streptomyces sp. NPDC048106 TaxID=3155750 RepID=UPI003452BF9F